MTFLGLCQTNSVENEHFKPLKILNRDKSYVHFSSLTERAAEAHVLHV
jgi:hypothetical protein